MGPTLPSPLSPRTPALCLSPSGVGVGKEGWARGVTQCWGHKGFKNSRDICLPRAQPCVPACSSVCPPSMGPDQEANTGRIQGHQPSASTAESATL